MNNYYAEAGVKPLTWVLDNEFSGDFRNACLNAAEGAIQTYKNI